MKHFKSFLTAFTCLMSSTAVAQSDYALFIHGFNGGQESWLNTNTPEDWVAEQVIDGYVNFVYSTDELASEESQGALIGRMVQAMSAPSLSNARWVLVGHSLGGIIARIAYTKISENPLTQNLNILAVLTVGAPHQGARAAGVYAPGLCNLPYVPTANTTGYKNVLSELTDFRETVADPLAVIHPVVNYLGGLFSPSSLGQLQQMPTFLDTAFCKLKDWELLSVNLSANSLIGVNGTIIQDLNSFTAPVPPFRRSVIGAEKAYTPVRAAADAIGLENGDEQKILQNFYDIRGFYITNRDAWNATVTSSVAYCVATLDLQCEAAASARRKRDRWARGRDELNNIDTSWGQIIDSHLTLTDQTWQWVNTGLMCPGDFDNPDPWNPVPIDGNCIGGELHEYQLVTIQYDVPTKNDVLVGPEYAVWSPGQSPNDQVLNFYYDDLPSVGGYNHFELRRHKRAYTLPNPSGGNHFQQGDLAPPMGAAAAWIRDEIFGGS